MLQKRAFLADSPDSGMKYPHKVGLASHIRHGNFGEVCPPAGERPFPIESSRFMGR
jgi:hypothetical protein